MVSEDSTSRVMVLPVRVLTTEKMLATELLRKFSRLELTDLHATTETKDEMQGGLLLDVVIAQGATILKLLASEDETLLIRRNAFLVLDLALDVVDGIARLDLKSDGLAGDWR